MNRPMGVIGGLPEGWRAVLKPRLYGLLGWTAEGWFTDGTRAAELIVLGFGGWSSGAAEQQVRFWIEDTDALDREVWW